MNRAVPNGMLRGVRGGRIFPLLDSFCSVGFIKLVAAFTGDAEAGKLWTSKEGLKDLPGS